MSPYAKLPMRKRAAVHTRRVFIAGLLVVVPIVITSVALLLAFRTVDGLLQPTLEAILEKRFPGLGIVVLVLIVTLAGILAVNGPGRHVIHWVQHELFRLPILGAVYSASEHLIESLAGSEATGFKHVVTIEYPRPRAWTIGFLTGFTKDQDGNVLALVYIPTAPTPNSGWVALVPVEEAYDTNLSVSDAMKLVLSGGIIAPEQITRKALSL